MFNTQAIKALAHYRRLAEQKEEEQLFMHAAFSKDHCRQGGSENDHRMPYKRDVDRIIHSKAYSRYVDKTQVVYLVNNDHITHRSLHVQLVSNFARGIAEILGLNLDLVEAIALGHDVGHPPFGHEGEDYLSALSIEYGNGPFCHALQSCRLFTELEPLNLGLAVYDGFLSHDGAMAGAFLKPKFGKTWQDHLDEREQKKRNLDLNIMPGTLEGCLVKLCDTMSYVGRDIEDAINLGILKRKDIPATCLGITNKDILSYLAADVIQNSYHKEYITISKEAFEALKILRQFNFQSIYVHPQLKVESSKIKCSYRILFEWLLQNLEANREESYVWKHYLKKRTENYLSQANSVQMIVDYISGMTDNFFVRTLEKIIVPSKIEIDK
ncbi:deoxyguanosinetriphosphate triphosphohydrolase family protein [Candidatus Protochlamydia sp. W-9]|uniref:deoxyguanosinetriphosphate triphosphohydrolase family protein n=1 Tax=Candidatus Protochlamydia sp. W-9 TaxID=1785087 RepID=UPI00096A7F39|nr:HD domain-containing protein [Candidatus Protochlamydia sp. W-9]